METTAIRFMILMRTRHPVRVLGPSMVSKQGLEASECEASAHILRVRLVDLGDRWLLVSTQATGYQAVGYPEWWMCPTCYALHENSGSVSRRTHVAKMDHEMPAHAVRCGSCDAKITHTVN